MLLAMGKQRPAAVKGFRDPTAVRDVAGVHSRVGLTSGVLVDPSFAIDGGLLQGQAHTGVKKEPLELLPG